MRKPLSSDALLKSCLISLCASEFETEKRIATQTLVVQSFRPGVARDWREPSTKPSQSAASQGYVILLLSHLAANAAVDCIAPAALTYRLSVGIVCDCIAWH